MYVIEDLAILVKGVHVPLNINTFYLEAYMLFIQLNQAYYQAMRSGVRSAAPVLHFSSSSKSSSK